jgi:hypothetical protein
MKAKLLSIVGLCMLLGSNHTNANQTDRPLSAEGEKKPISSRSMPFRGKLDSLDKSTRTIKVGARQFQVVDATKIMKAGKPSSLEEATIGEEVGGAYREADGGKLELVSLRLGAKPGKEEAVSKKEKSKEDKEVKEKKDSTE